MHADRKRVMERSRKLTSRCNINWRCILGTVHFIGQCLEARNSLGVFAEKGTAPSSGASFLCTCNQIIGCVYTARSSVGMNRTRPTRLVLESLEPALVHSSFPPQNTEWRTGIRYHCTQRHDRLPQIEDMAYCGSVGLICGNKLF